MSKVGKKFSQILCEGNIYFLYLSIDTEFKTEWKNCSAHMLVKSLILGKHFRLEQKEEYKIKKFEKIVFKILKNNM